MAGGRDAGWGRITRLAGADTNNILSNLVPSFTVQRYAIADGSSFVRPPNLRGLPPVIIVNADIDPLRDDGATLETALRNAGVQVQRRNYEGAVHEFFSMADVVRDAYDAQQWSFGLVRQSLMR